MSTAMKTTKTLIEEAQERINVLEQERVAAFREAQQKENEAVSIYRQVKEAAATTSPELLAAMMMKHPALARLAAEARAVAMEARRKVRNAREHLERLETLAETMKHELTGPDTGRRMILQAQQNTDAAIRRAQAERQRLDSELAQHDASMEDRRAYYTRITGKELPVAG